MDNEKNIKKNNGGENIEREPRKIQPDSPSDSAPIGKC